MASDSSMKELHTIVNEPWYEELYSINNKSDENDSCSSNTLAANPSSSNVMNHISEILLQDTDEEIISCEEEAAIKATEKLFYDLLQQESSCIPNQQASDNSSHSSGPICSVDVSDNGFIFIASQIQKGTEQAMKFLPNIDKFLIGNSEYNKSNLLKNKMEYNDSDEERVSKQVATSSDELIRNETYERLLHFKGRDYVEEVIALRKLVIKESEDEPKGIEVSNSSKDEKGLIGDLRPLLILCSQAVSINDHHTASKLIKKIRQHSFPKGDCSERLAHYFVNGLEARLAGTGSEIYREHLTNQVTAVEFLMAYRVFISLCPYSRVTNSFYNHTILNVSKNASKVHIIDFYIQFGFQWLSLFECFSRQGNTVPKIKITGVDNPQPGFRPAKRVEGAGRRLVDYAKSFNIPFEYNGIISKLEDFNTDDLNIGKDEVIVICLPASHKLSDETIAMHTDSIRDKFLKAIRKIEPRVFIHGVENSSYGTPFFDTRFKEALFHYSSLFDMLDSNIPRDNEERFILEAKWLGPRAINAIACEGSERVERAETYRQWRMRITRAGFVQLPVDRDVLKKFKWMRGLYHKEFVLDEDNNWVVLGWKGRILFAVSAWKCNDN